MTSGPNLTAGGPATVTDAPLSGSGIAFSNVVVGQALGFTPGQSAANVTVATFSDTDPSGTLTDYSATINWGDGVTEAGIVASNGSGFKVVGDHTYAQPGIFTIRTTVTDGVGATAILTGTASVGVQEGQQFVAVIPVSLPDSGSGSAPPSGYTATINWGDNSPSSGSATAQYTHIVG